MPFTGLVTSAFTGLITGLIISAVNRSVTVTIALLSLMKKFVISSVNGIKE
jgi:hypothetical protein